MRPFPLHLPAATRQQLIKLAPASCPRRPIASTSQVPFVPVRRPRGKKLSMMAAYQARSPAFLERLQRRVVAPELMRSILHEIEAEELYQESRRNLDAAILNRGRFDEDVAASLSKKRVDFLSSILGAWSGKEPAEAPEKADESKGKGKEEEEVTDPVTELSMRFVLAVLRMDNPRMDVNGSRVEAAVAVWVQAAKRAQEKKEHKTDFSALEVEAVNSLLQEVCRAESSPKEGPRTPSSRLASVLGTVERSPLRWMLKLETRRLLVQTLAMVVQSFPLAYEAYINARHKRFVDSDERGGFVWTEDLKSTFEFLFRYVARKGNQDANRIGIDLYHDHLANGHFIPLDLIDVLCKLLGQRGIVEEVERIVSDYEVVHGPMTADMALAILAGSKQVGGRVMLLRLLRLLETILSSSRGLPKQQMPMEAYLVVARAFAESPAGDDRRATLNGLAQHLLEQGRRVPMEVWNELLRAHASPNLPKHYRRQNGAAMLDLFERLTSSEYATPTAETYQIMLSHLTQDDNTVANVQRARNLINDAFDRAVNPGGATVAATIDFLARAKSYDAAKEVAERHFSLVEAAKLDAAHQARGKQHVLSPEWWGVDAVREALQRTEKLEKETGSRVRI